MTINDNSLILFNLPCIHDRVDVEMKDVIK